jgi:hypothetical protein
MAERVVERLRVLRGSGSLNLIDGVGGQWEQKGL